MASSRVVVNSEIVEIKVLTASVVVSDGTTAGVVVVTSGYSVDNVVITLAKVVDNEDNFSTVVDPIAVTLDTVFGVTYSVVVAGVVVSKK